MGGSIGQRWLVERHVSGRWMDGESKALIQVPRTVDSPYAMLNGAKEQELVDALRSAEQSGDAAAIESAVNGLALWFSVTERFEAAAPYWRRGVELLARSTAPNSRELGTYLHNMAAMCLIPAGLHDEARRTLMRAKEICAECFPGDAEMQRGVDELLKGIGR